MAIVTLISIGGLGVVVAEVQYGVGRHSKSFDHPSRFPPATTYHLQQIMFLRRY